MVSEFSPYLGGMRPLRCNQQIIANVKHTTISSQIIQIYPLRHTSTPLLLYARHVCLAAVQTVSQPNPRVKPKASEAMAISSVVTSWST